MIKRISIILFTFIALFSISSAYEQNDSWTDIHLETVGWCSGLEINFKAWNKTDFDNQDNIKNDLCKADENEVDDNCFEFHPINEVTVNIHSGPLESLPLIYDEVIKDKDGEFSYTFNDPGQYLLEIYPKDTKYNDYYEILEVQQCRGTVELAPKIFNQSFSFSGININLENTNLKNSSSLEVVDINLNNPNNYGKLNNVSKTIKLKTSDENFETTGLDISIPSPRKNEKDVLKLYKSNSKTWESIPFKEEGSKILIENAEIDIAYSLTYEQYIEPVVEIPEVKPEKEKVNVVEEVVPELEERGSSNSMYIILGILITIGIIGFFVINNKKRPTYHDINSENKNPSEDPKKNEQKAPEHLNSYSQVYDSTKKYVQTYKEKFNKDQIYRALKGANVPDDIIEKVFIEEF